MIVFEIERVEFEHHPEYKILELRWVKVIEDHSWELLVSQLIEVANSFKIENILFDASYTDIQPSIQVVQQLPLRIYIERLHLIKNLKKIARVASGSSTYDNLVQEQYASTVQAVSGIVFKNFEHRYSAMHWITGKAVLKD